MTARLVPDGDDPIAPYPAAPVTLTIDGQTCVGVQGQTIAGVALANDRLAWRKTSVTGRPRGVFCGIGVCFDCLVTVNGRRDVRACQRRALDGDVVTVQHDELPVPPALMDAPRETGAGRG